MANIVAAAAAAFPRKDALLDGKQRYTYGELDRLSSNFAAFLLSQGLRKGDRIAFCSPKSATLVVGILGCLKAGAIYVPMDSKLPKDRLLFILDNVAPRFIVCSEKLYESVAPDLAVTSGLIDEARLPHYYQSVPAEGPLPEIADDDVAYCIYTSGSTGRPKGVLIEHGSVDSFFRALAEVMPIAADDRCMNTSELYFDVHVMDLFFPLHRGATVHVACAPMVANKLLQILERERITFFTAVGPLMTLMTEGSAWASSDLSSVRRAMTGAEIINVDTMQKWLRKVPGMSLVNGYGPTEATVICTAYVIDRVEPGRTEFYPIGKPMRDTEVLLLDGDQIVAEPGVKGELLIGGPQVMKGYWNDERQTAERIVVIGGRRYYRSGDLCQWLPDGNIHYAGRNDEEIKLSGFRINLNEIKRVMDTAGSVREGHPVVAMHPTLGKVIAACFTRSDDGVAADGLFGHLQSVFRHELPYYMVPSLYFLFDRFPTLPSGKTDKKGILERVSHCIATSERGLTRFVCSSEEALRD